jgi:hypothetical protein
MQKPKSFATRRRQLLAQASDGGAAPPKNAEAVDDWNNFPNYFKFSNFANASVPDAKLERKTRA